MFDLKQHSIADTGVQISELGLGTVKFGRNTGVKYPKGFAIPTRETLKTLLEHAQSVGINYLDTAPAYGTSEETLGQLIRPARDYWVVSTKVGEYYQDQQSHYDFTKAATIASVEASLEKLGLDELDIVFVHSDGQDQHIIEQTDVIETLTELKSRGLIKAIGFSGKRADQTQLAIPQCDVFMIALNQTDLSQVSLIDACQKSGKSVVIKKALTSGHSRDPHAALQFVSQYPGVSSAIVGTINPQHLIANARAIRGA